MDTGNGLIGHEEASRISGILSDLFELHSLSTSKNGFQLRGRLLRPADEAHPLAVARLQPLGYTLLFRRQGEEDVIFALPYVLPVPPSHNRLALVLFILTALSVLVAGITSWDPERGLLGNLLSGVPYMVSLLAILSAHELGHYFAGRHYGVPLSLPYFIPLPIISPFGTLGAFIQLKAPPTNRRALLATAVAGPLCGLAVALPLLVLGLKLSTVGPPPVGLGPVLQEGNSLLYVAFKFLIFGRFLPGGGVDVNLHPVAFAAWAGLFVTGLNLIPAGQLDGGHIIYCLIGERARKLTTGIVVALVLLGFLWPGWFLWAALVLAFGQAFAVPLDDITRLDRRQTALAIAMLVILVLIFMPIPLVQL